MKEGQQETKELLRKNIPDLFNMSSEQEKSFMQAIEAAHGEILVFVHPYYNLFNTTDKIDREHLKRSNNVNVAINQALQTSGGKAVLVMEEYTNIFKLNNLLNNLQVEASVAKIDTDIGYAILHLGDYDPRSGMGAKNLIEIDWQKFVERLKALGVKKVRVGGQFLFKDPNPSSSGIPIAGCVGEAIKRFSRTDFKVYFGETSPVSAEEIKDLNTRFTL